MSSHNHYSRRAAIIGGFFALCLISIGARAAYLQLMRGESLSKLAVGQVEERVTLQGQRGTIYDTRHQPMAVSVDAFSVAANPEAIEDKPDAARRLAAALHLNPRSVLHKLTDGKHFVWLKRQASPREAEEVRKLKLAGIEFISEHNRFYPNKALAAQVLGFTGIDGHGLEGIEFLYERELQGGVHSVTIRKDALGRGFDSGQLAAPRRSGNNLVLTIDGHIQYISEQALAQAVTAHNAKSGMAIVMNPATGALLAMAHYPFFNPNVYGRFDRQAWRNRAITDPFEPGSTMKIFSAAAALEDGISSPHTIFYCENGSYLIGSHTLNDTKAHGWLSLQQIVKYSSNIGVVKVAEKIGPKALHHRLRDFGFGKRSRVDCPGESPGALSDYKRWTALDTSAIAFGQGVSVTGLQLVTAVAALANNGLMMRPQIVRTITDASGRPIKTFEPQPVRQVVSTDTALAVRRIMRSVITSGGTGMRAELDGYSVSGKTGTAQKIDKSGQYAPDSYMASFVGFAPAQRPALAVLVVVDEPEGSHYGGIVAAPAFKQIIKESLGYLNIAPGDGLPKLRVSRNMGVNG